MEVDFQNEKMFALLSKVAFTQLASDPGYIEYGAGDFDGQGSGDDFYGDLWHPPFGFVNNSDGGRSHTYSDYRQQ